MSRIGNKPIIVPEGVSVSRENDTLRIKGPKGELAFAVGKNVDVKQEGAQLIVSRSSDAKNVKSIHGTTRSILDNMVTGVSEGFSKQLDLIGVGYTAEQKGKDVLFNLGYSHPIYFQAPEGIEIEVTNRNTTVIVKGIDKQVVGQVAAKMRDLRKPEPYKGKGVRYTDEYVVRKAGKTVGGGA